MANNKQFDDLIERWNGFLAKIESRFYESVKHAEAASLEQLEESGYDYNKTRITYESISTQIRDLIDKIKETWDNNIAGKIDRHDLDDDDEDRYIDANNKGIDLVENLDNELEDYIMQIEAKLAEKYYQHVMADGLPTFECLQCGTVLTPLKNLYRTHYVTCTSCNTVNSFKPSAKYQLLNDTAIACVRYKLNDMNKADIAAYAELNKKLKDNNLSKAEVEALWDAYHETYTNYHRTYFKELAKLDVSYADRFEESMERKENEFLMKYKKVTPLTSGKI